MNNRGGKRPGAGRPKKSSLKEHKIYVPDYVWERLEAEGIPPSAVIVRLVDQEMCADGRSNYSDEKP